MQRPEAFPPATWSSIGIALEDRARHDPGRRTVPMALLVERRGPGR